MKDADNTQSKPTRRGFVKFALGAISAGITAAIGVPLFGFYIIPALKKEEVTWLAVGPISDFKEGETKLVVARPVLKKLWPEEVPKVAVFVSNRGGGKFDIFHTHCTHVGCPIQWNPPAQRFFSPCHGGVFDRDGKVLAGPPPRLWIAMSTK
ncbi:MAG: ubiquinol-cytochrome c reductase iron-sulfur subunit [Deltaproteobacteria bacterium]|nr:ubiquinol-cytochrome c reductase iron-sulfur subunit [Deltaproteobacteria bacterium]